MVKLPADIRIAPAPYPNQFRLTKLRAHLPTISMKMNPFD